jgi:superfamily I DNA/RNA helicase
MGSNIKYINNFTKNYSDAKEFYLQTSYRLPKKIVDLSNNLME